MTEPNTRTSGAGPIGRVLGTEDATPVSFWFAVSPGCRARLDDVVTLTTEDPAGEGRGVTYYGVIDQVRRRHEGVQFDSDTELIAEGLMPAEVSYAAHVLVTRLDPEEYLPPRPGDAVHLAQGEALEMALYVDGMGARLPAGVLRSGDPAYINLEFIDGTRGAHVNISGISGVATKTSYALFLLYALFHGKDGASGAPLLRDPSAGRAVVFNVKGEDLLFLDHPNTELGPDQPARYARLGLPCGPFGSVAFFAPPGESSPMEQTIWATIALSILSVPTIARVSRAQTMVWADREFVLESRTLGTRNLRIMVREILPNILPAMFSFAFIGIAVLIVVEAALAFFGVGDVSGVSWGIMIQNGRSQLDRAPHMVLFPSLFMFLTILALNTIGDRVRDVMDVKEGGI